MERYLEDIKNRQRELFSGDDSGLNDILMEIERKQTQHEPRSRAAFKSTINAMISFSIGYPDPAHRNKLSEKALDDIAHSIRNLKKLLEIHNFNPDLARLLPTNDHPLEDDDLPLIVGDYVLMSPEKYDFLEYLEQLGTFMDVLLRLENVVPATDYAYPNPIKIRRGRYENGEQFLASKIAAHSIGRMARYFREMGIDSDQDLIPWIKFFYMKLMPDHYKSRKGNVGQFIRTHINF